MPRITMIGAIPSKMIAVQASSVGIPQRASVSRIASSPLMTAQVCRRISTPTVTRNTNLARSSRLAADTARSSLAVIRTDAMAFPLNRIFRCRSNRIGHSWGRCDLRNPLRKCSVPLAADVQAVFPRAKQRHGEAAQQIKHLRLEEIMVPMISGGIVRDHEKVILGAHQAGMRHDEGDDHEYAEQKAAEPSIGAQHHRQPAAELHNEAEP